MKRYLIAEIVRKAKTSASFRRQLKIAVTIGFVGFLLVGGLTIWAGISAVKYVAATASQVIQDPKTQSHLQSAKAELQQVQLQPFSCWQKTQALLMLQPWVERPVGENLRGLQEACLQSK